MKRLAAKPLTSPVIPPPKEIKTSFLEKFLFNKTSRILLTLLIFLFFSLALKNNTKILLFLKDLLIFETNFFGTFLSTTIKHLSKSIEFDLKISDKKDTEVNTEDLSAGERQLLAVAILWGLAKASNSAAPTIIDTPLGRLDSEHRFNLVEQYFPTASKQVILLSTDEEINKKYHKFISPYLSRSYKIEYDEKLSGSKLSEGYFF